MSREWQVLSKQVTAIFQEIKERRPLIHMIPNGVSAALCADGMSALGARPLMALDIMELQEIVLQSDAIVINLGQLSQEKINASALALTCGAQYEKPLVLDPVGCGASQFRLHAVQELLALSWYGLVKGNRSEIYSIQKNRLTREGIDSVKDHELTVEIPEGRVYLATGRIDSILWNGGQIKLFGPCGTQKRHSYNIVGSGCLAGAVAGACYSVAGLLQKMGEKARKSQDSLEDKMRKQQNHARTAAIAASLGMTFALEQAEKEPGYGSAKMVLLNALDRLAGQEFQEWMLCAAEERRI